MGDTDHQAAARVQRYDDGAQLEALAHMTGQAEFDAAGTTSQISRTSASPRSWARRC